MNRLKAKFSKKADATPLTAATKEFIKGSGDQGLGALPEILEACSSASHAPLASQVEVLDLVAKYYGQDAHLGRQLRSVDLLRYLSDQRDNELFNLLSQGHALVKTIDTTLRSTRSDRTIQKASRSLLDHLVRQPNVPESIVELHAKHVNGINRPHRPTIILTDQEVVADDLKAAEAESELLSTLLTDSNADDFLLTEVYDRLVNTKQRLVRDVDTSTNEQQTVNLISAIEATERVLSLYREMRPGQTSASSRRTSIANSNVSVGPGYAPPFPINRHRASVERSRSPARSNGKSRESPNASSSSLESATQFTNYETQIAPDKEDAGEGTSHGDALIHSLPIDASQDSPRHHNPSAPTTPISSNTEALRLSSNNPFAKVSPQSPQSPVQGNPFAKTSPQSPQSPVQENSFAKSVPHHSLPANPFTDLNIVSPDLAVPTHHTHFEGDLDEQWRTLKL